MSAIPSKSRSDGQIASAVQRDKSRYQPIRETILGTFGFFPDGDAVRARWERIVSR